MSKNIIKEAIVSILTVFILIILYRFALPFSDEPDWSVKSQQIANANLLTDKFKEETLKIINYAEDCNLQFNRKSILLPISIFCNDPIIFKIFRIVYVIFLYLLLFIFAIHKEKFSENNKNILSVIILTSIFPSTLFHIGLFSNESLVLFLGLIAYILNKSFLASILLSLIAIMIDRGNGLIILVFYLFINFIRYYQLKINIIKILISIVLIALIINFRDILINLLSQIRIINLITDDKLFAIIEQKNNGLYNEHNFIIRLIIIFSSFILMTPNGVKSEVIILICFFYFIFTIFKFLKKNKYLFSESLTEMIFVFLFITIIISIFPNYSNAKYFIFIIPFILKYFLECYNFKIIFLFLVFINSGIILNLSLLRFLS